MSEQESAATPLSPLDTVGPLQPVEERIREAIAGVTSQTASLLATDGTVGAARVARAVLDVLRASEVEPVSAEFVSALADEVMARIAARLEAYGPTQPNWMLPRTIGRIIGGCEYGTATFVAPAEPAGPMDAPGRSDPIEDGEYTKVFHQHEDGTEYEGPIKDCGCSREAAS
jgi:hypothetical protein